MGDDPIGRTRIVMQSGTVYLVTQDFDQVTTMLEEESAEFTSLTGQSAFPPERLRVMPSEVAVVQECSFESWVWQQRAAELHYARQLQEATPQDRLANVLESYMAGDDDS